MSQTYFLFLIWISSTIKCVTSVNILNCKCGESPELATRILGGKEVHTRDYPWMVYIEISSTTFCGGVLINDFYILTAQHCLDSVRNLNFTIYMRTINRVHYKGVSYRPVKVVRYEDSRRRLRNMDAVLIKLNKRVVFSNYMFPICLPHPDSVYPNVNVSVLGWGVVETGAASKVLKEAVVTVKSENDCKTSPIGKYFNPESMLCAYRPKTDACKGDSGGPLFYNGGNDDEPKYELIGLVSWGVRCASELPGVYTKVSSIIGWISRNTQDALYCSY